MEFFEAPGFTRNLSEYLSDDEYKELQAKIAANPQVGDLMPGTGGFRKMRWGDVRRGKGRRGGLRIIYYYFPSDDQVWLITVYDKSDADDLTPAEKKL
jgi:mRNA-degrading endonuclease RelE of RelBE toxin-antitoxin system